ncbi:MAG: DUF882 domain-containing protein [Hyphomicrobiales bacterium]|nr:DUF882 domain-containing protein [Hyphomicrobiales bacterium]
MKCASRGGAVAQLAVAAAFTVGWLVPNSTESAVANGDTRTIVLSNQHTNESGSFTFMVNGVYDQATLDKLNWFCRDWRLNEPTKMDPHLFDIVWEVYRESGSTQPVDVLSGYRSPQTNAMLRRRSRQVAEHSQHMQGKAMDAHFLDVSTGRIRDIAMRMQAGGVGFYPTGITPWVHIDSGSVRYWPRMSRNALTRLFPDGKTVFIPADGQPMPGYEQARAEIEARGGDVQVAHGGGIGGLFSWLFGGGGSDDAEESGGGEATTTVASTGNARGGRSGGPQPQPEEAPVEVADVGPAAVARAKRNLPTSQAYASAPEPAPAAKPQTPDSGPEAVAKAKRNLPTGPAYASAPESAPTPPAKPQAVAELEQPNVASDVTTDAPAGPKILAPLPPRRPADLAALAFADAPMPPVRPVDLVLASAPQPPAFIPLSNKPFGPAAPHGLLPQVITAGVDRAPTGALALAEGLSPAGYDDNELLARAAALTAPLPPMPIPDIAAAPAPTLVAAASPPQAEHGWVARTAAAAAEDFAQLFGGVFKRSAPAETSPGELRASQQ